MKLVQHLGPFKCVPLKDHLYYYYCWMHIQPDWHICRSGTTIKMKCLRVLSINTDLCSNKITNQKTKNKKNYYMISKTNGLIDYMNEQHKSYSMMERTFHLWFTKWEFNFLFSFRTLTMWSVSAYFILKSTKYLMVVLSTACDCVVCFLNMSTSSLSAEAESLSTTSLWWVS